MMDLIQYIIDGLALGSVYALVAVGYSMVFGVLQLVNFAHGEFYMMGAYFVMMALTAGAPWPVAIVVGGICVGLFAILIERLIYLPLRGAGKLAPLITAVGLSLFLQNFVQTFYSANPQNYPIHLPDGMYEWGEDLLVRKRDVLIFFVTLALTGCLQLFVNKTKPGSAIRAVAMHQQASRIVGVPFNRTVSLTFFIGAFMAVIAGAMQGMATNQIWPMMGVNSGLKAFAAAVLGGIGVLPGAVLGGLVLGVCESLLVGYNFSTYKDGAAFLILILVLLIRPQGLLGKTRTVKV